MNSARMRKLWVIALAACWPAAVYAAQPPATTDNNLTAQEKQAKAAIREAFEAYWESQAHRQGAAASAAEKEHAFQQYWEGIKKKLVESDKQAEVSLRKVFESEWASELKRTGRMATPEQKKLAFRAIWGGYLGTPYALKALPT